MSTTEIQQAASHLSERERALLALWLLESLPSHDGMDATEESVAEAARRRGELDSGEVTPLAADDFWRSIEGERSTWR